MNRKIFTAATFFVASMLLGSTASADKPMNVLFIVADDLNSDMSTFGFSQVKTPNLDRLAAMGVRFDNAYCQQALCGPSRASIMTGKRPNTTGFVRNYDSIRANHPDIVTLGQFFKNRGYYSGRVGKIYHYDNPAQIGTNGYDDEQTWTERFNPAGIDKTQEEKIIQYVGEEKNRKGRLGISMAWWDPVSEDEEHTDGMVTSQAIKMIEAHKDEPFFIATGFFNPHCPYVAPKKYFDLYNIKDIAMPDLKAAKEDLKDVPPMAYRIGHWPYYFKGVTMEEARQCKLAYYATISFMDAQIGRLLDALEENDLMENTIIVFWSDHGYFLGEKGLWFKRKAFERAAKAPLIIAVQDGLKAEACRKPVEMLDLYPTLVDYTGFEVPKDMEGVSLRPLLTNPRAEWNRPAITQVFYSEKDQGYSLRTERWRYTEWNRGQDGVELYDHENDPEEITNLAKNPEYAALIDTLSHQLRAYSDTYKPKSPPSTKRQAQ